jgi:hypothetical protein
MDPYLESPLDWHSFHTDLIVEICRNLQPQLSPAYVSRSEQRVVLGALETQMLPDVHIHESAIGGISRGGSRGGVAVLEEIEAPDLTAPQRCIVIRSARSQDPTTVIEVISPGIRSEKAYAHTVSTSANSYGVMPTWSRSTCYAGVNMRSRFLSA